VPTGQQGGEPAALTGGVGGRRGQARVRVYTQSRIEVLESMPVTEWREVRRGWCLGSEEFRDRMLGLLEGAMGGKRRESFERRAAMARHDENAAAAHVARALAALGVTGEVMRSLRKNDSRKQALGWCLRKRVSVTDRWITERLGLGHRSNLLRAVRRFDAAANRETTRLKGIVKQCADLYELVIRCKD